MTMWKPKRFWTQVHVAEVGRGYGIRLDERPVRTPAKALLEVPSRPLAQAIAAEWEAQAEEVRPATMPLTRIANSAIDKVAPQFGAVADLVAAYGETDLICYRADAPEPLARRQAAAWDPLIDWIAAEGAPLTVTAGVMHVGQPSASVAALRERVIALSPFELAAFHDVVAISGSLVMALAVLENRATAAQIWSLSRVDEIYQAEVWGQDAEAEEAAADRQAAFLEAARFLELLRTR